MKVNHRGGGATLTHQSYFCDCYVLPSCLSAWLAFCEPEPFLLTLLQVSVMCISDMIWPYHYQRHRSGAWFSSARLMMVRSHHDTKYSVCAFENVPAQHVGSGSWHLTQVKTARCVLRDWQPDRLNTETASNVPALPIEMFSGYMLSL